MIFDIDLFKSVNDRFGHDAGDAVIRHVANVCQSERREADILAMSAWRRQAYLELVG